MNAAGHETTAQAMGRALFELGFPALVSPSTRDRRGRNLRIAYAEELG